MVHLVNDVWLDADKYQFFFVRKGVYENGKRKGEEFTTPFSFHATGEQVSSKIIDLAMMDYVNGDYRRAMNFFTEAHTNLVPALKELNHKRYDI